jgi:hypothetical protein
MAISRNRRARLWAVFSLPPPTLDTGRWITVSYPPAVGTVLSVRSNGATTVQPPGSQGPGELAVPEPDRVVYAPLGAAGAAFLLPYAAAIPNQP